MTEVWAQAALWLVEGLAGIGAGVCAAVNGATGP